MINTAPAVVIGAGLNGLGVVRSLAHERVPSIVVDTTRWRAAMWSRHCRKVVVDQLHGRSLVDSLLKLRKNLNRQPVLILTDETAVSTVSENRDELYSAYRFHLPPRNMVATLKNKARFQEFAEQHDLRVPRTIVMRPDTPFEKLSTLSFPVIVKPAERKIADEGKTGHLHYIATLRDAEILCRRLLESTEEMVVQEWIEGPDSNICFSLYHFGHKPENFKIFTGRKFASNPAMVGNTALCFAATEVMDSLEPLIAKFLDLTEFQGLGSLEFKWDQRQRQYVIIGHTVGRTDWQEEIATFCGVNLPLAAYRDENDLPPIPSGDVDRTVAWRESWAHRKDVPMLPPGMRVVDGYWRLNDPAPGLFHSTQATLAYIRGRFLKPIIASDKTKRMQLAAETKYRNFVKPIFK